MTELCEHDATELRRLIGTGQVSPVAVLDSCIARIEQLNPVLNATVELCLDEARVDAKRAEKAVQDGAVLGPLHGLPIAIKEAEDVKGHVMGE